MNKYAANSRLVGLPLLALVAAASNGCWPGAVMPRLDVRVRTSDDRAIAAHDATAGPSDAARVIVLKYWWNLGVNDVPESLDLLDAFVTDKGSFSLQYPLRFYLVTYNPALGVQHLAPVPRVALFAEQHRPVFAGSHYGRAFCCAAPEAGPYAVEIELRPATEYVDARDRKYDERQQMLLLAEHSAPLDRALRGARAITDADRLKIYRQLRFLVTQLSAAPPSWPAEETKKRFEKALPAIELQIAKLECRTG